MSICTAPVEGHKPDSGERDRCPACGSGRSGLGSGRALPPPVAMKPASFPKEGLLAMPVDQWDELVRTAGLDLGSDETILDQEDFEGMPENPGYGREEYLTLEKFHQQASEGRRTFDNVHFDAPMGERETRGMVFTNCRFGQEVTLGDRAVMSHCRFDRNIVDPATTAEGGRISAIVEHSQVAGDVRLSGTSYIAMSKAEIGGDLELEGGNGMQALFISDPQVDGIIYLEDSESIVLSNQDYGNVIAFHGSAEETAKPGANTGGTQYSGWGLGDRDDADLPAVHFVSYDDLQEARQLPGQAELDGTDPYDFDRLAEMNERVDRLARERYRQVRGLSY